MKKIIKYLCVLAAVSGFYSCEIDNLQEPTSSIKGTIYDHNKNPMRLTQGKGSMSIRMTELSWLDKKRQDGELNERVTDRELNVKMDGTYLNDKIFDGTYLVYPWNGAWYPLDSSEYKTIQLKSGSTTTVDFDVIPYFEVEWVEEPRIVTYNEGEHPNSTPTNPRPAGDYFRASAKFKKVYKDGVDHPGVKAATFIVGNTHWVDGMSDYWNSDFAVTDDQEGEAIAFVSNRTIEFTGMTYYFRIGFKNNRPASEGDQKWNYTTVKEIEVK